MASDGVSSAQIVEWRALADAATSGPLTVASPSETVEKAWCVVDERDYIVARMTGRAPDDVKRARAVFFAAAHTAVTALLEDNAELRAANARMRTALDACSIHGAAGETHESVVYHLKAQLEIARQEQAKAVEHARLAERDAQAWQARCEEAQREREAALREGFSIAEDNAEVSTHDGWQTTAPTVDMSIARKELEKLAAAIRARGTTENGNG